MPTWLFLAALAIAICAGYRLWRYVRTRRQLAADEAEEMAIERYELAWQSATYHWVGLDRALRYVSVGATAVVAVISTGVVLASTPPTVERWVFHPAPAGLAEATATPAPEGATGVGAPAAPPPSGPAPQGGSVRGARPAPGPANPVGNQPGPSNQPVQVGAPAIASSTRLAPPSPSPSPITHAPSPSPAGLPSPQSP